MQGLCLSARVQHHHRRVDRSAMAGKGRSGQRIEPSFAGKSDRDDDELTIDADDRIVGGSPAKGSGKAREKYPKGRKTARSGRGGGRNRAQRREGLGFIGLIRRLIYWCLVLALWGGIGVAGIVLYYGSRMPSASTWQIPARPPNVKINAMDGTSLANRGATGGEALALEDMSPFIPRPSSPSRTGGSIRISASTPLVSPARSRPTC